MKLFSFLCITLFLSVAQAEQQKPRNIIMFVGDGMGPAYTTAYRNFIDDKSSDEIADTVFDRLFVGMASTYPARVSGYITDSAASATALSTGHKSYNGAIGVDANKQPLLTVLQWAKSQGMRTGVAVTSQINHATPASFAAHNEYRRNYDAIADAFYDQKVGGEFVLDVMFGGGTDYFVRDDRNIVEQFKQSGYQYIDSLNQLGSLNVNQPTIGLFAESGMPWALDTPEKQRLVQMVKAAVAQLENENENGYFLLVEGSQIDWAGHANDIASAMAEMHDFALALEWLEQYVDDTPNTLLVGTADHSTGGLTIAAITEYRWDPEPLKNLSASLPTISKLMSKNDKPFDVAEQKLGFTLSKDEKHLISQAKIGDDKDIYLKLKQVMDLRTNTGWTTDGHTGIDVQVFAKGLGAEQFEGHIDNTDIPKVLFKLMGKN
ncbi:alkaline phosphatase [Aliiglaciecola sp. M165]|uniref:alkaline phosphatase n=1 Tax=Aliiglaciecola sp. M165 TaxID=2593649 RepID=UPI00117E0AF5|nr:alkaline phosphatase [Aliiglaciecola sp. M165]TRY29555.1 alkaline phosphatase [Aliiglaciecola sp. M165]